MNSSSNQKLNKIDAIIVVTLIIIAGLVLTKAGIITTPLTEKQEPPQPQEPVIPPPIPTPPTSLSSEYVGFLRAVSPEDEGLHFDKITICREWWYFTAIFSDENSDLKNWVVTVSFNHMALGDLMGTLRPDLLVVTLNGPNGEEYGGLINKERGLGLIQQPTLQAKSPGVSLKYENSWAEGIAPKWHIHAEDNDIDKNHEIIIDLEYFSPSDPLWTIGERAFQKSQSNLASYIFIGCEITGTVEIDGIQYSVEGIGHHEHSWSPLIVTRKAFNGWDWSQMVCDNGWIIYFSNYYPHPQYITTKSTERNLFGTIVVSSDQGETFTILNDIELQIIKSDEKLFPFVKMPSEFNLIAQPTILQPLIISYDIELDLDIVMSNTCEKVWKVPTYVGMKVGMAQISGKIAWKDIDGNQNVELNGIGTIWSMRALL